MNSREKAQRFICYKNEPTDTDLADIDTLAAILDDHAEGAMKRQREADATICYSMSNKAKPKYIGDLILAVGVRR